MLKPYLLCHKSFWSIGVVVDQGAEEIQVVQEIAHDIPHDIPIDPAVPEVVHVMPENPPAVVNQDQLAFGALNGDNGEGVEVGGGVAQGNAIDDVRVIMRDEDGNEEMVDVGEFCERTITNALNACIGVLEHSI